MTSVRITQVEVGDLLDFDARRGFSIHPEDPDHPGQILLDDPIGGTVKVVEIRSFRARTFGQTGRVAVRYEVTLLDGRRFRCGIQERFVVVGKDL